METTGVMDDWVLPALSVTVTDAVCADPSPVTIAGLLGAAEATPDVASLGEQLKDTSLLFQPFALAAGLAEPKVNVGAVASRCTVTLCELLPPALVAWQMNVSPVVSLATL